MQRLTCGVALITYNGIKYLPQQLDSIVRQTRAVDQIVISDDGSTDGTLAFLETWIKQSPIPAVLLRNEKPLGVILNFERAISAVNADIIFSSDQDDVWLQNKVELLASAFERDPEVVLAHTDAILVDAHGRDMGTTLLGELELSNAEKQTIQEGDAFHVYCRRSLVTGATAAFRRSLLEVACPLPSSMYHDAWLAFMAAATGKIYLLDAPTIYYRQHGSNVVGVKKKGRLTKLRQLWWEIRSPRSLSASLRPIVSFRTDVHARLLAHPGVSRPYTDLAAEALDFAERRSKLPRNPILRTGAVLRNASAGKYQKFSHTPWADVAHDILKT
jgi:glycosyltransferase involved in cell wall biosynthesis